MGMLRILARGKKVEVSEEEMMEWNETKDFC